MDDSYQDAQAAHRRRQLYELTRYTCSLFVAGDIKSVGDVLVSMTRLQIEDA